MSWEFCNNKTCEQRDNIEGYMPNQKDCAYRKKNDDGTCQGFFLADDDFLECETEIYKEDE